MEPEAAAAAPAPPAPRRPPVARPLLPVALALMVGIAAPAWGFSLPEKWLVPGLVLIWAALALLWWRGRPVRLMPLAFFALLGVAFCQQALHPVFPPQHLVRLPETGEVTLAGALSRPGKLVGERVQLVVAAQAALTPGGWRPVSGRLLVTAPALTPPPLGSRVVLKGRLLTPRARQNPGTFDRPRYLATDGIFREMRLRDRDRLVFLAGAEAYPLGEKLSRLLKNYFNQAVFPL
jgi:hypothetical protein